MDTPIEVLKWIGIVLAAGFIGYFGRYLAMLIIDRIRRRRGKIIPTIEFNKDASPASEAIKETLSPEARLEQTRLKLEKKRAKQRVKKVKKAQKS